MRRTTCWPPSITSRSNDSQAVYDLQDGERLNWHFIPRARKGLPLKGNDLRRSSTWRNGLLSRRLEQSRLCQGDHNHESGERIEGDRAGHRDLSETPVAISSPFSDVLK